MIRRFVIAAFAASTLLGGANLSVDQAIKLANIDYMPTRFASTADRQAHDQHEAKDSRQFASRYRTRSNNLVFNGGKVETTPKVYLVFWGSQWSSDPDGEAAYLVNFYNGLYGSQDTWSNSTTQYCQGVSSGSTSCGSSNHVTHPASSPLVTPWQDNASTAPHDPSQTDLGNEAIRAASHFGNTSSSSNASVQYVIATSHGNNETGFGTQWCAWHSGVSSSYGTLAFTNLPYISDATWSCGAGFVNSTGGTLDGVSIVGGHEYAESITDPFPSSGWLDRNGSENGDKCAWVSPGTPGGAKNVTFATGTYPIQSLWSNNYNNGSGGCVSTYVSQGQQNG